MCKFRGLPVKCLIQQNMLGCRRLPFLNNIRIKPSFDLDNVKQQSAGNQSIFHILGKDNILAYFTFRQG